MVIAMEIKDNRNNIIPLEISHLEKEKQITSNDVFYFLQNKTIKHFNPNCFLYHGIRFDDKLVKLENIFKVKKILSGNKISNYYKYDDNANKGEYVSLLSFKDNGLEYDIFIKPNISLLVDPLCDAILTKYVSYDIWDKIKNLETQNIYSYMNGEYLCKDYIPFDMIKGIGVPYKYYLLLNGKEYADEKLSNVKKLMKKYDITLPILDTSHYNEVLYESRENNDRKRNTI